MIADDPYWPRASAWLAGEFTPSLNLGLAVIGAPLRLGLAERTLLGRLVTDEPASAAIAQPPFVSLEGHTTRGKGSATTTRSPRSQIPPTRGN